MRLFSVPSMTLGGAAVPVQITAAGHQTFATFSGTAGQTAVMFVTQSTLGGHDLDVYDPSWTRIYRGGSDTASGTAVLHLTTTGTYVAAFEARGEDTGSAQVRVAAAPPDVNLTTTLGGAPVDVTLGSPGQTANVTFTATADERIVLRFTNSTFTSTATYELVGPGGDLVGEGSFEGSATIAAFPFESGTHTLRIRGGGDGTGSVRVQVSPGAPDVTASATIGGSAVHVATTEPWQGVRVTFSGSAGAKVAVRLTGSTVTDGYYELHDSADEFLDYVPIGTVDGAGVHQLPATGAYTLVMAFGDAPGELTVQLVTAPANVTATATVGGAAVAVSLTALGQRGVVSFAGTASQRVYVEFASSTFSGGVSFDVVRPNGAILWSNSFGTNGFADGFTLAGAGTYKIAVRSDYGRTGSLTVRVAQVPADLALTATIGGPPVTVTTVPTQDAAVSFTGQGGQQVTLAFANSTYTDWIDFYVLGPDDNEVTAGSFDSTPYEQELTLPADGTYTIDFDLYSAGTLTLTVTANQAFGGAPMRAATPAGPLTVARLLDQQDECTPAADDAPGEDGESGGDPVDLGSGLFVDTHTDLVLPDVIPIQLTRTYRQRDNILRSFGVGTSFNYDGMFLQWVHPTIVGPVQDQIWFVQPDSSKVLFNRTTSVTSDLRFAAVDTTGPLRGATITGNDNHWTLTRVDGTSLFFSGVNALDRMELLQSITDRYGNQITLVRDNGRIGHIVQVISPNGRWIKLTWAGGAGGHVTRAEDNTGRIVDYAYDATGRLTDVTRPGPNTTHYAYDTQHRMTSITDARGITYLSNTYDSSSRVATQTLAATGTYQFAYQVAGSAITKTTVTDPLGDITETTFDASHRVLTQTSAVATPQQRAVPLIRDPATHLPTQVSDPTGTVTAFTYNGSGDATAITTRAGTPGAKTTSITPGGPFGQFLATTTPDGQTTSLTYDSTGNVTSVTDAAERVSRFTHNDAGQLTTITDTTGKITMLTYDRGDLIAVTDPTGHSTRYLTDAGGRQLVSVNALGAKTINGFDANSNITAITDPLGVTTSFTYDANGNLTSVTDGRGHTTTAVYDNADRVSQVTDPLGKTRTWTYNLGGQVASTTDQRGVTTVTQYDKLGRLTFVGYGASAGPTYASSVTYAYDSRDRLATVTDTANGTTTFGYDSLDQLTSVATPTGTIAYTYDAVGRRSSMTVPGQLPVSYSYDADTGALTSMTQASTTATWQRDEFGRVTAITQPGLTRSYSYNDASQVSALAYTTTGGTEIGRLTYRYDANGRISDLAGSLAQVAIPNTGPTATYDAANRLTSLGAQTFTYDDAGNLLTDGTQTYTWNARGELATVAKTGLSASFAYDPAGRRRSSTVNGTTTSYLYDGETLVQEQSGGVPTSNRLAAGIDQTLQISNGSGTHAPLTDLHGSTVALADTSGALGTHYTYDPYGTPTTSGTANPNTQKYTGREYNAQTGLSYHRARYYSPTLGRFISQDPAGFGGGSTNLYQYALNDPINLTDPFGDCPICAPIVAGCVIGGLTNILFGWALNTLLDRKYTWKDILKDFGVGCAIGAVTEGIGGAIRNIYRTGGAIAEVASAGGTAAKGAASTIARTSAGEASGSGGALIPKATTTLGDWGESRLAQELGGAGFKPSKPFKTSLGPRYVDRVVNRSAYEAKAGIDVKLTSDIRKQILKDAELLANGTFDEVTWYFFQGASKEVLDELTANGIRYVLVP